MIRIAIVEDSASDAALLQKHITRYQKDHASEFSVKVFTDGVDLMDDYVPVWDVIFLDIQMRHSNGMETAERIRRVDTSVVLIFITSLSHYAIQGYQVNALDYILKPINYIQFSMSMWKAEDLLARNARKYLLLPDGDEKVKVATEDILYMEVADHDLKVVTETKTYLMRSSLNEMERSLQGQHFSRCNHCYLVNLRNVQKVGKETVTVPGHSLPMSRAKKSQFLKELSLYLEIGI